MFMCGILKDCRYAYHFDNSSEQSHYIISIVSYKKRFQMLLKATIIRVPYIDNNDFINRACVEISEHINESYCNLLRGEVYDWECDIFHKEITRWKYKKYHSLYIGVEIRTTFDREKEKDLYRGDSEFPRVFRYIEHNIKMKFKDTIDCVTYTDKNRLHFHLNKAKTKEILSTPIGRYFEVDKYVLRHEDEIYEMDDYKW